MKFNENKVKNVFLYAAMPTAAAIVAVDTVPTIMNNPLTALFFVPVYILIADTYNKTLKKFGGVK